MAKKTVDVNGLNVGVGGGVVGSVFGGEFNRRFPLSPCETDLDMLRALLKGKNSLRNDKTKVTNNRVLNNKTRISVYMC